MSRVLGVLSITNNNVIPNYRIKMFGKNEKIKKCLKPLTTVSGLRHFFGMVFRKVFY